MDKYVIVIKVYDRKYEGMYRLYFKMVNGYRELRDYLVKYDFNPSEYIVFKETDIIIKKERGIAR